MNIKLIFLIRILLFNSILIRILIFDSILFLWFVLSPGNFSSPKNGKIWYYRALDNHPLVSPLNHLVGLTEKIIWSSILNIIEHWAYFMIFSIRILVFDSIFIFMIRIVARQFFKSKRLKNMILQSSGQPSTCIM